MLVRERVLQTLKDRGMTQTALARRLNEEVDWINTRLRGRVQIKADELPKIADALGVHPCFLLTGESIQVQSAPQRQSVSIAGSKADEMYARYQELLAGLGIEDEDSDLVIAVAEFLRQRRLQRQRDSDGTS